MDSQWQHQQHQHAPQQPTQQTFPDAAAARRHNGSGQMPPAASIPAGYKYEPPYHGSAPVAAAVGQPPSVVSPSVGAQFRDGNGDIPMHDARDAHAGLKYPMRPHQQSHLSGNRPPNLQSSQEPSSAAQRYSPMDTLSPTSPYSKAPSLSRQSPSGTGDYSPGTYFTAPPPRQHAQQLPPIAPHGSAFEVGPSSAVANLDVAFSHEPKPPLLQQAAASKKVPEFRNVRGLSDLHPKNKSQPPFRRANPEGGFISVSIIPLFSPGPQSLTDNCSHSRHSPATYPQPIVFATRASSMRHHATRAGFLRSRAKASRMTATTTKTVTIFFM